MYTFVTLQRLCACLCQLTEVPDLGIYIKHRDNNFTWDVESNSKF